MKGSLIVIVFFCVGCIMGVFNKFQFDTHTVSMYILYALMLQVGISIGSNKNLKAIISHLHPKMLLIPLGTITGTLLFSALASILPPRYQNYLSWKTFPSLEWPPTDCCPNRFAYPPPLSTRNWKCYIQAFDNEETGKWRCNISIY